MARTATRLLSCLALASLATVPGHAQAVPVDDALPTYQKVSGIAGNLSSVGSDTLLNLMTFWGEAYRQQYPNVRIQIEGKGSSTAPPALISGTAQLGPMSRAMKAQEVDDFAKRFGYKPTAVRVALDSLAVFVNKDNPIEKLTLPQIDAIFSKNRNGGMPKPIDRWGDLGLSGSWAAAPLSLYGRNSASGTYGYFKEHALFKGDYRDTVKEQPGSASVVQGVAEDLYGIGYSGIGYKTSGVKAVALAASDDEEAYPPSYDTVASGEYPLARFLRIYVNKAPNRPLDPLIAEFLRFVCSRQGQEIVVKDGYLPLTQALCEEDLAQLK